MRRRQGEWRCSRPRFLIFFFQAAINPKPLGLIDNWLRHIQDVYRTHIATLDKLEGDAKVRKLVELNTAESVLSLYKNTFVQQMRSERNGFPKIHGLVYDIKNGKLNRVEADIPAYLRKYTHIYTYDTTPPKKQ